MEFMVVMDLDYTDLRYILQFMDLDYTGVDSMMDRIVVDSMQDICYDKHNF